MVYKKFLDNNYFIFLIFLIFIFLVNYNKFIKQKNKNIITTRDILKITKKNPKIEDLLGTWIIDNPLHPFKMFNLKKENILHTTKHLQKHNVCKCSKVKIIGAIILNKSDTVLRNKIAPFYTKYIKEDGYILILHSDGVIKFFPNSNDLLHIISLGRADSLGWIDFIYNYLHSMKYGCFCLGILTKNNEIKRYNRWANKFPSYYYTAKKSNIY